MTLTLTKIKNNLYPLLGTVAFIIATAIPSWAGPLTDAENKSKTYADKLTTGAMGGGFNINGTLWAVIGMMLIIGIAIKVGFATMDGMGAQKTWRDHLWDVLGAGSPVIFGILFMGLLINWVTT
jgi:hypothetical protein